MSTETTSTAKPGLDAFYSVTPSLKFTGTINTDFGETEVDARQINLERFSLFFPEKRAFFLEGAGVFTFQSTGPEPPGGIPDTGADIYPFFSRRIGLLNGREVPVDAGVKLIGTVGRTEIGVLDIRTGDLHEEDTLIVDETNFFVGRVRRNFLQQSYVGAIFTDGSPVSGRSGQTYGADVRLGTSRFLGASRNFVVNGYAARSVNDGVSDDDWSYGASADYPNDKWLAQVAVKDVQKNFNPAIGFVQRSNVRMLRAGGSYNPRPRFFNILNVNHDAYFTHLTRLDNNETESWNLYVTWWDWHFRSGDAMHGMFDFNPTYERLFEPFELSPGVILRPGEYRFTRFRVNPIFVANRRMVSGNVNLHVGQLLVGKGRSGDGVD